MEVDLDLCADCKVITFVSLIWRDFFTKKYKLKSLTGLVQNYHFVLRPSVNIAAAKALQKIAQTKSKDLIIVVYPLELFLVNLQYYPIHLTEKLLPSCQVVGLCIVEQKNRSESNYVRPYLVIISRLTLQNVVEEFRRLEQQ